MSASDTGMARWRFSFEDQVAFAELSGDWNPLHTDRTVARRTMFGEPIVHGMHLVMRALDRLTAASAAPIRLVRLRARFRKPVRLGEVVEAEVTPETASRARVRVMADDAVRAEIFAEIETRGPGSDTVPVLPSAMPAAVCREVAFAELTGCRGALTRVLDPGRLAAMFQHCRLPHPQMATLLATSRLVGMVCPGLHSVYAGFDLRFHAAASAGDVVAYRVTRTDERFSRIELAVEAPGADGTIEAFFRPGPVPQASYESVKARVPRGAFADQRPLIVGGSRGLGEATAKVVAAGGADVRLTFNVGDADALRVVEDIRRGGGVGGFAHLDVTGSLDALTRLAAEGWRPTHLYYFATPPISASDGSPFSPALFERFSAHYVTGFWRVVRSLRKLVDGPLTVFYPSTRMLDDVAPGAAEFASAKAAGEALCAHLASSLNATAFRIVRLPRVRTDQTAGIQGAPAEDALTVMLDALEEVTCR